MSRLPDVNMPTGVYAKETPLSVEVIKSKIDQFIAEKKYSDAARWIFNYFDGAHNLGYGGKNSIEDFARALSLETYDPIVLQQLFSATFRPWGWYEESTLIESIGKLLKNPYLLLFLVKLNKTASGAVDTEHYRAAFSSMMYPRFSGRTSPENFTKKQAACKEACIALLATENFKPDWYSIFEETRTIMHVFAEQGDTEAFKRAILRGASVALKAPKLDLYYAANPLTEGTTPLDLALRYNHREIVNLILAEIKKFTENEILKLIHDKKWNQLTDDNKNEIECHIKKTVRKKYLPCRTSEEISCVVDTINTTTVEFFARWAQMEMLAKQAASDHVGQLAGRIFRLTNKLIATVSDSMSDIFGHEELAEKKEILECVSHRIISEKKRALCVAQLEPSASTLLTASTTVIMPLHDMEADLSHLPGMTEQKLQLALKDPDEFLKIYHTIYSLIQRRQFQTSLNKFIQKLLIDSDEFQRFVKNSSALNALIWLFPEYSELLIQKILTIPGEFLRLKCHYHFVYYSKKFPTHIDEFIQNTLSNPNARSYNFARDERELGELLTQFPLHAKALFRAIVITSRNLKELVKEFPTYAEALICEVLSDVALFDKLIKNNTDVIEWLETEHSKILPPVITAAPATTSPEIMRSVVVPDKKVVGEIIQGEVIATEISDVKKSVEPVIATVVISRENLIAAVAAELTKLRGESFGFIRHSSEIKVLIAAQTLLTAENLSAKQNFISVLSNNTCNKSSQTLTLVRDLFALYPEVRAMGQMKREEAMRAAVNRKPALFNQRADVSQLDAVLVPTHALPARVVVAEIPTDDVIEMSCVSASA